MDSGVPFIELYIGISNWINPFGFRQVTVWAIAVEVGIAITVPVPTPSLLCGFIDVQIKDSKRFTGGAFFDFDSGDFSFQLKLPKTTIAQLIQDFFDILPESVGIDFSIVS